MRHFSNRYKSLYYNIILLYPKKVFITYHGSAQINFLSIYYKIKLSRKNIFNIYKILMSEYKYL